MVLINSTVACLQMIYQKKKKTIAKFCILIFFVSYCRMILKAFSFYFTIIWQQISLNVMNSKYFNVSHLTGFEVLPIYCKSMTDCCLWKIKSKFIKQVDSNSTNSAEKNTVPIWIFFLHGTFGNKQPRNL